MWFKKNWKPNLRSGLLLISVGLLLTTLGGCGSLPREPIARNLPATPSFAQPVNVAAPKVGEPMLAIAARERAGRKRANSTILNFRKWYGGVRKAYGAK